MDTFAHELAIFDHFKRPQRVQPASARKLGRTRHTLGPSFSHSRGTLIKRDLLLVPPIKVSSTVIAD